MKSVIMLGLYHLGLHFVDWQKLRRYHHNAEIWTMNDFYAIDNYRDMYPDLCFQVHSDLPPVFEHPDGPHRFPNCWIEEYNNYLNMRVMVTKKVKGLNNQILYPFADLASPEKFGIEFFLTTQNYMFAWAMENGYKHIAMYGFDLRVDHHKDHVPHTLYAIELAKANGINVYCPMEAKWREDIKTFDWGEVKSGLVPYHMQDRQMEINLQMFWNKAFLETNKWRTDDIKLSKQALSLRDAETQVGMRVKK